MVRLSVVIITFNEERNIGRCIDSLQGVADEIVVVDSNSTDATQQICISKGARFLLHAFEGYIEQKNFALEQATFNHILSLDADEALSDELRQSILRVKTDWTADVYSMNRLTNYCGTWVRHGGWYPDRKVRLFRKESGRWGGINPHDEYRMIKGGNQSHLAGDLLHYSYYSSADHDRQIDRFSAIGAKALFEKGVRSNLLKMVYKPAARFIRNYLLKLGLLDGKTGWTIARKSAKAVYWKYQRLYRLQKGRVL